MKCGKCDQLCSDVGHLKGKEAKRDKNTITFECVRCGVYMDQQVCECCASEIGALAVSGKDTAEAAAKRREPVAVVKRSGKAK